MDDGEEDGVAWYGVVGKRKSIIDWRFLYR
jgi:hypothetical protein